MDNIKKIVGSRLKDLRSNKSQSELCISLNREYQKRYDTDEKPFTQAKISKIEKGEQTIDYSQLIVYADYFKVTVDYILGREKGENENVFYPDSENITVNGIFSAINYLLEAFGADEIIDEKKISYMQDIGFVETEMNITVPILNFCEIDFEGGADFSPIDEYLKKIKSSDNIKKELESLGEKDVYISLLKKWANVENLKYNKDKKRVEEDIELPF